jgi:transketolase
MASPELIKELEEKKKAVIKNTLTIFEGSGGGHVGGSFSLIDIVTALYFHQMKIDPDNPYWPERDRLILSKAHCCETLYAAFAEIGWISKEALKTYYRLGSPLQGHADRWATPGIEFSGGSLGEGLSYSLGMALASRIEEATFEMGGFMGAMMPGIIYRLPPKYHVYCILGDGECHEGQVWEAAMAAAKYRTDNLIAIVDYNKYCVDGPSMEVMKLEPFAEKWKAFGWWVTEINGHDLSQIVDTLHMTSSLYGDGKPKCIIAHTIKGKGVPEWESKHTHYGFGPEIAKGMEEAKEKFG